MSDGERQERLYRHLVQFVRDVRRLPLSPIVVRIADALVDEADAIERQDEKAAS